MNKFIYYFSRPWFLVAVIIFMFIPVTKLSQALESGAEFLKIDTDARAMSMASSAIGISDGINALNYNPAGLANMRGTELALSHTNWFMGSKHDFIGIGMRLGQAEGTRQKAEGTAFGIGLTRLTQGGIEGRNADRSGSGSYGAYDQSISLAMGKRYGSYNIGGSVKYLQSSIAGEKAVSCAVDLGVKRGFGAGGSGLGVGAPLVVGLSAQNLGPAMRYLDQKDPLPLSVSAGFAFMLVPEMAITFDAKRFIYDKYTSLSFGTEYAVVGSASGSALLLRAGSGGFGSRDSGSGAGGSGLGNFSAGAGIRVMDMDIDYAVNTGSQLDSVLKISVKKKF